MLSITKALVAISANFSCGHRGDEPGLRAEMHLIRDVLPERSILTLKLGLGDCSNFDRDFDFSIDHKINIIVFFDKKK